MRSEDVELRFYNLLHDLMWARDNPEGLGRSISGLACYVKDFAAVETFDDAGLLTADRGLVITTESYKEFRLTITNCR